MKKKKVDFAKILAEAKPFVKKYYRYIAAALAVLAVIIIAVSLSGKPGAQPAGSSTEPVVSNEVPQISAAFDTVPVITLDGECLNNYSSWNDKSTYYPATLTFTNGDETFTMDIEIKPQGTSSLFYPKKNFTVKFAESVELVDKWGAQQKYVLKADYIDPTSSANVVSAKLAAQMNEKYGVLVDTPNYGVIDGFPIWVKINGEDAGIFNLTIPKDTWLFNMDADNPNHLVLACEGWSAASVMKSSDIDYEQDWSFEVGEANEANTAAFERMVNFVATADDETFVRDFDQYLDLDACLNYICYINTSYALDNVAKNMLMVTYDGKVWYPALYDLDSLWGIYYDGMSLSLPEGVTPGKLPSDGNHLLYRVRYCFGEQLLARYRELRAGILSKEHIMESFETYAAQIPQEYYDINNAMWYSEGKHIRSFELMSAQMDYYLPIIDEMMMTPAAAPVSNAVPAVNQGAALENPLVHYVWETDGVQHSLEDIAALPVSVAVSYTLDGKSVSAKDVAGKSGKLEMTLRAEHKAVAEDIFGVAAVVQLQDAQCKNITVTGGNASKSAEKNTVLCTGSAWLTPADSVYEMKLAMDVTGFEPAKYVVTINPVYAAGGGDTTLNALLATASELTAIINEGITLHSSLSEWHAYLTNIQTALESTAAVADTVVPAGQEATAVMKNLLIAAETDADALLKALGHEPAADMTSEVRVQMLSQIAADPARTEGEKQQANKLAGQITSYVSVISYLENQQLAVAEIGSALAGVNGTMKDLVGAYGYANDTLYGILYKISTLYQNIANYYASLGGGASWVGTGDWQDVIIFTNHENMIP